MFLTNVDWVMCVNVRRVCVWMCRYFNEAFRDLLRDNETGEVSTAGGFLAGLGAGVTEAVLIVTPFEVVKTRLQMQKGFDKTKLR